MQIRAVSDAQDLPQVAGLALLGSPSETLRQILKEFQDPALRADREAAASAVAMPRKNSWVIDCTGGDYEYVSRYFARCKRASWGPVGDLDDGGTRAPGCLILMGHEANIRLEHVFRLTELHPGTDIGIMAARSVGELSSLVAKTLIYAQAAGGRDVCIAPEAAGKEVITSSYLTVYPSGTVAPVMSEREPVRTLSLFAHGNEDYVVAGPQRRFCGKRQSTVAEAREPSEKHFGVIGTMPACVASGSCAFAGDELLSPQEVQVRAVLLNSCLSAKGSVALYGSLNDFSVGQAFLDGWAAALLASPLLKDGSLGENLLFHALVDSGATMGECARALNDYMRQTGLDAPSVVLWGDPELRLAAPRASQDWTRLEVRQDKLGLHLQIPAGAELGGFAGLDADHALRLVPEAVAGDVGESLFWFRGRLPIGEGVLLLPADPGYRVREDVSIVLRPAEQSATSRYVADSIKAVDQLRYLGIYAEGHKGALRGAEQSLPSLVKLEREARLDLARFPRFAKRRQPVLEELQEADTAVLNRLLKRTRRSEFHFVEGYRDTVETEARIAPDPCPYCGEVVLRYECRALHDPGMRRFLDSCAVCGANQDVDSLDISLSVSCDMALVAGQDVPFSLQLNNDGARPVQGVVGGAFTHGDLDGLEVCLADSRLQAASGESVTVRGSFLMNAPSNLHTKRLRLYVVAGGRVLFAGRSFGAPLRRSQ